MSSFASYADHHDGQPIQLPPRQGEFLNYLRVILRTKMVSVDRYWFHLRHVLIWLDEIELSEAHRRTPTFFDYMQTVQATRSLAPTSVGKIVQIARRFFT